MLQRHEQYCMVRFKLKFLHFRPKFDHSQMQAEIWIKRETIDGMTKNLLYIGFDIKSISQLIEYDKRIKN